MWRAAFAAFVSGTLAVVVCLADFIVPPDSAQGLGAAGFLGWQTVQAAPKAEPWVRSSERTGCRNWGSIAIGATSTEASPRDCGRRCQRTPGCVGFSHQSACAQRGSCVLRSGSCDHVSNTCWDDYDMVHDDSPPVQCQDRGPGLQYCSEWCNHPGFWDCGLGVHGSHTCDCTGCSGCGAAAEAPSAAAVAAGRRRRPLPGEAAEEAGRPAAEEAGRPAEEEREPPAPTRKPTRKTVAPAIAKPPPAAPDRDEWPENWPRVPAHAPDLVKLPEGWKGPWDDEQPSPEVAATWTFGFYFPIYNLAVPAVLAVLRSVRKYYPDSPVHVLQDGGNIDYGGVCALPEYGCVFEQVPAENSRWNPHSWLLRMYRVAHQLGTTYVIYLEPDVLVRGRHRHPPAHDAGGIYDNFNPMIHDETAGYLQKMGRRANPCFKLRWRRFGLAGGSYFRTAAILDAFDPVHVKKIDWNGLYKLEGERIFSSDLVMIVALSARGFTVYPWREAAQKWKDRPKDDDFEGLARFARKWPAMNPLAAFEHNHKEAYSDSLPKKEQSLINRNLKNYRDLYCHGCVWYTGPRLETLVPVKRPQTWDLFPPPEVEDEEDRLRLEEVRREVRHPEGPLPSDRCFKAVGGGSSGGGGATDTAAAAAAPRAVTTAAPSVHTTVTVTAPSQPSVQGLPSAPGLPPAWLRPADLLVADARGAQSGGILLASTVLVDGRREWGGSLRRPGWIRASLATNRNHVQKHGHAMVLRWKPTLRFPPPWQEKECDRKENAKEIKNCWLNVERENFNWEKHQMMVEYLSSSEQFTHVFVLDADAVLVRPEHDTFQQLVAELEAAGKDLLLSNEDWIGDTSGRLRINGGLLFAKNTAFNRDLFKDMLDAHWFGPAGLKSPRIGPPAMHGCASNEQLCIDGVKSRPEFQAKVLVTSGLKYNCGANDKSMKRLREGDPSLQIMHFMGGSKSAAAGALCRGKADLTGEGPKGYGCSP